MEVVVRDLSVTVITNNKQVKTLLDGVSFTAEKGDVVALMGPSGAGKTTLLNRLVGRGINGQVTGSITCGRRPIEEVRTRIGYVTQDDIMYEQLTPRENLTFAAAFLNADGAGSPADRGNTVENVLKRLRLENSADTIVGTAGLVKGISGGERKRTNVAMSLLSSPSVLLLDEPTSGLDAKMAEELMTDVSVIAGQGCTVIATIHQPSDAVFEKFAKVLLLDFGHVAYFGRLDGLRSHIVSLHFPVKERMPLPELLLDILEVPEGTLEVKEHRDRLSALKASSLIVENADTALDDTVGQSKRLGWCGQFCTLLRRNAIVIRRTKFLTVVRFMQTALSTAIVSWIFVQLGKDMVGVNSRIFSSFLLVFAQFLFALLGVANTFPSERCIFFREAQDRWYHPTAFYLAKITIDTVMQSVFPLLVLIIGYPLIGLNTQTLSRPVYFYIIMVLISNCGAAVGLTVSAAVSNVSTALSVLPGLVMPQMLLCGIFVRTQDLPQPFNALSHVIIMRFGLQAVVTNEFTCDTNAACDMSWRKSGGDACSESPCDFCCTNADLEKTGGVCPVLSCLDAQRFIGLDIEEMWPAGDTQEDTVGWNILALLVCLVFVRILGLVVLLVSYRRSAKSG
eukprot:TRINITY_DN17700_c0_g3_i2.p1 TRINITY_DN17700_c0_g3~~TRINITY_DN17700_c0_g3_i2.p1  ORF type:complete len:623 (-),score=81.11 TRINITY_DN17700_c0_g3_i2:314-2182(-)